MRVRVTFESGVVREFVVPEGILLTDFVDLAYDMGGKIKSVEFL